MNVLLLHPEDTVAPSYPGQHWDLVVDLGRAPLEAYDRWSRRVGCPVISIYDHAEETEDLYRLRELLQLGRDVMVDALGIDWWDVLALEIASEVQQFMLIHRLSKKLSSNCELYSSRPHSLATALRELLGTGLTTLETRVQSVIHGGRHYRQIFSRLDSAQLVQVLADKFDAAHSIRHHFTRRGQPSGQSVILLPSAYVNVSRTVLSYAELFPDQKFLLVHTRRNAKVKSLPANVCSASLTPYFVPSDKRETASLLESWNNLTEQLIDSAEEFNTANAVGVLGRIPALLPWGIALRNAWSQIFESENVTACLTADDSNPPSSIPLILAKRRCIPALACHHGALDYKMAIKVNHADFYLVKSEMERDYLSRVCRLGSEKMVTTVPVSSRPLPLPRAARQSAPWLVFFTEPYQNLGWRTDEVYRYLLPRLCRLAQTCGLKLVFKLHPFESIKGHRRMLRRFLPEQEHQIEVLAGPPSDQLWNNTRLALTVQSSTALECASRGVPIFLCAWLRDPYSGYVHQYERFGVGQVLESPEQIAEIPRLLKRQNGKPLPQEAGKSATNTELAYLFSRTYSLPMASNA
ncbi:MAG TPA: hypothetical protein VN777_16810 [Terriglobales bacterium]|nr:hypothetical protein [Terriglobales bacterium]